MAVHKSETTPGGANGPFVLQPIGGPERFGSRSQATTAPLSVELVGRDGRPPQAAAEVEWSIVKGPPGADLGGSGRRVVALVDSLGHASTSMRLAATPGTWVVRATLLGAPDCVDAYFRVYSDGVVSSLTVLRANPTAVDRPTNVVVLATDWLGTPVTRAKLGAAIALDNGPPTGATSVRARGGSGGRYRLRLTWRYAGDHDIVIADTQGECSVVARVRFLPAAPKKLLLRALEEPREHPPYDRTVLVVDAFDRFGNVTKPSGRLAWRASSGRIEPVTASPSVAGAALLVFAASDRPSSKVTVRAGKLSARYTVELPGVFFRPLSGRVHFNPGQRFRFSVEAFAPAGGGTLKAITISMKQPRTVRRVVVRQPNPANGLPAATVRDDDDGALHLTISGFELSLPTEPTPFVVAELEYECIEAAEACFEALAASMTISRSPDRDHPLNPKTSYCPKQKEPLAKRLCVHFCLVTKPGGKTLEQLKADAQKQVDKAQKVFDDNIPICCPKITIKACFDEFKWADYQPLTQGGTRPGEMEGVDYDTSSADKAKDGAKVSDKLKQLLKKCRKPNCHTVYFLPDFKNKSGGTWYGPRATTLGPTSIPRRPALRGQVRARCSTALPTPTPYSCTSWGMFS
ncbi:MAG TPA: hypothetical protein VEV17_07655 [Bryobacteraceae bacterium]|nr:hypothetical protein [Bryobacteraceae bacterium]